MKCSELTEVLKGLAPRDYACEWDNPGLLAGRSDREVKKIYTALDTTDQVVEAAIEVGAHMLLTHYPPIFRAIKQMDDQNFTARRLVKLIQSDISYYVIYTSFDAASGCMADLVARRLGLEGCVPLELLREMDAGRGPVPYGIGKTGILRKVMAVGQVAKRVRETFDLPFALVYGQELTGTEMTRISLCPKVGGSGIEGAASHDSQVLVIDDISHHQEIDAAARQMAAIDVGHCGLERIFIPYMAEYLETRLGDEPEIIQAPPAWPAMIVQGWQDQVYSWSRPGTRTYGGALNSKGGKTFGTG